jgi:integrase
MRRKKIPAYRLHKPSGQARVIIDGKSVYLGPFASPESETEYKRRIAKLLVDRAKEEREARANEERDARLACADYLVSELIADYLAFAKTYYRKRNRETTEYANVVAALRLILDRHGTELASDFGPRKLKAIRQSWIEAGIVRAQCNRRTDRVRVAFAWAVSEELLDESVLSALKTITGLAKGRSEAREGRKVLPVADAMVDAIRPHVSRQVWAMIQLQRTTGARPGEICCMRTIDLNMTGEIWEYRPSEFKTEHHENGDRVIFLGPRAIEVLKPWLRPDLEGFLFQPCEAMAEFRASQRAKRKTPVQPSQTDRSKRKPKRAPRERYGVASYRRAVVVACKRAGVPCWHPHRLRHSVGTKVRSELGLEAAQVALGHKNAKVTEAYAERDQSLGRRVAERFG